MVTEIILSLLFVILVLLLKITYGPTRPQGTLQLKETVSARSQIKTPRLPDTNLRVRSLFETSSKTHVSSGSKINTHAKTSITSGSSSETTGGSSSETPYCGNVLDQGKHDRNDETNEDRNLNCDSNGEIDATDMRDMHIGNESLTDAENNCDSYEEDDDTSNEDDNHDTSKDDNYVCDEQQIFESYVDRSKLENYIKSSGRLCGLMEYISKEKEEWKTKKLNIAITGNSGVGKSSLINALMDLRANDEGAAKVGITESTTEMKEYPFPGKEFLVLWDLPGIGTQSFKKEEYLSKCDISKFEVLIIATATRFTENDIWLAKKLLQKEKYVFFIRTKIDIDLENEEHDHPDQFDIKKCLQAVREEIKLNIKEANILVPHTKVYVVSSRNLTLYDFQRMFKKLKNIMNRKGVSVQKYLERHLRVATENEKIHKKKQFLVEKITTAIAGFIPIGSRRIHLLCIKNSREACERAFCMNSKSLERVSEEVGITTECLKEKHLKYFNLSTQKHVTWYKPPILSFLHGYRHFRDTLHDYCDILAKDECTLINLRIKMLEEELLPM